MINQLREGYRKSYKARNRLLESLTDKEKQLFLKVSNDLQFNLNNLPGFFFIEFPHSFLLETPSYVWQTWFYKRHIWNKTQTQEIPILSLNQVYKELCRLIDEGYFRMNKESEQKYLKHLIYECVTLYMELGVLVDIDKVRKEIRYDRIPLFQQINANIFIELYYNQIYPLLNAKIDFKNNEIPENIRKAVFLFQNHWKNARNGYLIKDEYKWNDDNHKMNNIVIYTDQNRLDTALRILTKNQKNAISFYMKKNRYSVEEICNLLVVHHQANGERNKDGSYKIYPFVEEYIFSSLWLWENN